MNEITDCNFYKNEYPDVGDHVMVKVISITEIMANVELLEYGNKRGIILLSELSRRRIRSINNLIRVNTTEIVTVIRVDKEKHNIDLSKKQVSQENIEICRDKYNRAKITNSIIKHIAFSHNYPYEDLFQRVSWPLAEKHQDTYAAFKIAATSNGVLDSLDIPEQIKTSLMGAIKLKFAPQQVKLRADIECTCFTEKGVDGIIEACMEGMKVCESIKIHIITSPIYIVTCMTDNPSAGIEKMNRAIAAIAASLAANGGTLEVKREAKEVTQSDEIKLQSTLDQLAKENEEVEEDEDIMV